MQPDSSQILGLDQIADAVNRAKLGSQRRKNEMIRLGTTDPTSFQMNFKNQLKEQQGPQDSLFAGNKLAGNQNPDQETVDYVGNALSKAGGKYYYYGDSDYSDPNNVTNALKSKGWKSSKSTVDPTLYNLLSLKNPVTSYKGQQYYQGDVDPSSAQWGTTGYNTQDLGDGTYNILGSSGSSIGKGYKGLDDTIKELAAQQEQSKNPYGLSPPLATEMDNYYPTFPNPTQYSNTSPYSAGDLDKWEVLGQVLNGKPIPYDATTNRSSMAMSGDNQNQSIKGLQSLFGSTPLIYNNKVMGYKMDPTPATQDTLGYVDPYTVRRSDTKGSTQFSYGLQRQYNDPNTWNQLTKSLDANSLYVPSENAEKLPGWTNVDNSQYHHQSSGLASKIMQGLGSVLSFTPLAPMGLALSTLGSLSSGNHLGGILGAVTGGLGQAGAFDKLGSSLGNTLGTGSKIGSSIVRGGVGALSGLAQGGGVKDALLGGVGAGLGPLAGNYISSNLGDTLGKTGANMIGSGASGALQSLFKKQNIGEGALSSSLASGLGDFLSTMTNNTGSNYDSRRARSNSDLAKTLVNLVRQQRRNR
jgi:hypothetical protein